MRRVLAALLIAALTAATAILLIPSEDDEPVDPGAAGARRASSVALEIVPGRVVGVARDRDNGKWEVTVRQRGRDYEVELSPGDLSLLRIDYD